MPGPTFFVVASILRVINTSCKFFFYERLIAYFFFDVCNIKPVAFVSDISINADFSKETFAIQLHPISCTKFRI